MFCSLFKTPQPGARTPPRTKRTSPCGAAQCCTASSSPSPLRSPIASSSIANCSLAGLFGSVCGQDSPAASLEATCGRPRTWSFMDGSMVQKHTKGSILGACTIGPAERCRGAAPAQSTSQLTSTSRTQRVRLSVYAPLRARTLTVGIARSCPKKAASCVRLCDPLVKSEKPDKAQRSQRA